MSATMLISILCGIFLASHLTTTATSIKNVLDSELSDIDVQDDLGNFEEDFQETPLLEEYERTKVDGSPWSCDQKMSNSALPDIPEKKCDSYPTVVPVPPPTLGGATFYIPRYVMLHRCAGACSSKQKCQPMNQPKTVEIQVKKVHTGGLCSVKMQNETECQCKCIKTKADCGPNQFWKQDICDCANV